MRFGSFLCTILLTCLAWGIWAEEEGCAVCDRLFDRVSQRMEKLMRLETGAEMQATGRIGLELHRMVQASSDQPLRRTYLASQCYFVLEAQLVMEDVARICREADEILKTIRKENGEEPLPAREPGKPTELDELMTLSLIDSIIILAHLEEDHGYEVAPEVKAVLEKLKAQAEAAADAEGDL